MINQKQLESIFIFEKLPPDKLEKLKQSARIENVKSGDYVYKTGDKANCVYSVLTGKVALEFEKDSTPAIPVKSLNPSRSFGLCSMVDKDNCKFECNAKAITNSELVSWSASDLEKLFQDDLKMGLSVYKRIAQSMGDRLKDKNSQIACDY